MSQTVDVIFYDGVVSRPQQGTLSAFSEDSVELRGGPKRYLLHYNDMQLIGALGQIKPVVELPNEIRIEFLQTELPDWFSLKHKDINHKLWHLERSPALIVLSLVVVIAVMFGAVKFGIPFAAKEIAFHLPADSLDEIGVQVQEQITGMTANTQLSATRQQQIRQLYLQYVGIKNPAKLVFRQGKQLGENALALPNHTIVLTDELVNSTKDDRELIGVLAHEQGHLVQRHSLQQIISAMGTSALITWVTGDISDFMTSIPAGLLSLKYSRDFERQADLYALNTLHQQHIPVHYLADFLKRMEDEDTSETLSTHPATPQRIAAIEAFEREHQIGRSASTH